jgi:hypothetical protein
MPNFRGIAEHAAAGCLVKPLILRIFQDEDFPFEFYLHVARSGWRPPDGWFHASSHPVMSEQKLYDYIAHPERVERENMGYIGIMSTMFGSFMHEIMKAALAQTKVWVPVPPGMCRACGKPQPEKCNEHGVIDEETRSRGHMDGVLNFGSLGTHGWDLKTAKALALSRAPDMDLEYFMGKWPSYYGQAQEYMRLSGLRRFIVSFIGVGNPWPMLEYHIGFDPMYAFKVEQKYKRVLAMQPGERP